jgi:hypothetical protein
MKKVSLVECLSVFLLVAVCGVCFAATVYPLKNKVTIANTSVAYPLMSVETATGEYTVSAGANNTGTIYIGDGTVTSASYGTYLNAGDTETQDKYGHTYRLDAIYVVGTAVNDTVTVKYSNI